MKAQGQLCEWLDGLASLGGVVSAAEAVIADRERILFRHASGYRVGGERLVAGSGARFDAASLTKPWMATLALALDAAERRTPGSGLELAAPLTAAVADPGGKAATLEDLLRHCSGMTAWTSLALRLGGRLSDAGALKGFLLGERRTGTRGAAPEPIARVVYSDLGFLLWGVLAEGRTGRSLAELLDELVCVPLGLSRLGALAHEPPFPVECRLDNGKEVELAAEQGLRLTRSNAFHRGVPQDGNARALRAVGVFPAHAGLFVTADEMLALAREWLFPERLLDRARVAAALAGAGTYALGWSRWSVDGSAGPALSPSSFGHTGFTGGSVWIDPEGERIYLLLAHRLASAIDFQPYRREFHRRAVAAVE